MQKAYYFRNKGQLVAGALHLPAGRAACPAVLMLHGFTGQRCESRFLFVRLSRTLAEEGIASFRIDFRGSGESEGEFEDMTPLEELGDARAAFGELGSVKRIDPARLGVLGLSLGGMIAAMLAGRERRVRSLALWSAVSRPREVFASLVPKDKLVQLESDGRVDIGGLYLGRRFAEVIGRVEPVSDFATSKAPLLLVHGTADKTVPYSHSTEYLKAGKARGVRTERFTVKGGDHVFSSVPWRNEVLERTVSFFRETLSRAAAR